MLGSLDVDDVVQEVFVRAWERLGSYRGAGAFGGWLRRLAVNVVLRHRERRARFRRRFDAGAAGPVDRSSSGRVHDPQARLEIAEAVRSLPEGARQVFVLYDIEGYSHDEIARLLECSPHTSRSQLHRARALLRERLR